MPASSEGMMALTPHQAQELARWADGKPHDSPSTNLIRRNLVMHVAPHGAGLYVITEKGRAALGAIGERLD